MAGLGHRPARFATDLDTQRADGTISTVVGVRSKQVALVVLLLASAMPSCGRRRGSLPEETPQAEWSLTVINRHSLDVTVFVISDGRRTHVGSVPSLRTVTYVLPSHLVGPGRTVRLEANAIGSRERGTTEALLVRGGQHVEWTLQGGLDRSSVAVW